MYDNAHSQGSKLTFEFLEHESFTAETNGIATIKFWSKSDRKSMVNLENEII